MSTVMSLDEAGQGLGMRRGPTSGAASRELEGQQQQQQQLSRAILRHFRQSLNTNGTTNANSDTKTLLAPFPLDLYWSVNALHCMT